MSYENSSSVVDFALEMEPIRNHSLNLLQAAKVLAVAEVQKQTDRPLNQADQPAIITHILNQDQKLEGLTPDEQRAQIKRKINQIGAQIPRILGRLKWITNHPESSSLREMDLMKAVQLQLGQDFTMGELCDLLNQIYTTVPNSDGSDNNGTSVSGVNTNLGGFKPRTGWIPHQTLTQRVPGFDLSGEETRIWMAHFNPNPTQTDYAFLAVPEIEFQLIGHKFDHLPVGAFEPAFRAELERLQALRVASAEVILNLRQTDDLPLNTRYLRSWLDEFEVYRGLPGTRLLQAANRLIPFDQLRT